MQPISKWCVENLKRIMDNKPQEAEWIKIKVFSCVGKDLFWFPHTYGQSYYVATNTITAAFFPIEKKAFITILLHVELGS